MKVETLFDSMDYTGYKLPRVFQEVMDDFTDVFDDFTFRVGRQKMIDMHGKSRWNYEIELYFKADDIRAGKDDHAHNLKRAAQLRRYFADRGFGIDDHLDQPGVVEVYVK